MKSITSIKDLEIYENCIITFSIDNYHSTNSLFSLEKSPNLYYGIVREMISYDNTYKRYSTYWVLFPFYSSKVDCIELGDCKLELRLSTISEINMIKHRFNNNIIGNCFPYIRFDDYIQNSRIR